MVWPYRGTSVKTDPKLRGQPADQDEFSGAVELLFQAALLAALLAVTVQLSTMTFRHDGSGTNQYHLDYTEAHRGRTRYTLRTPLVC